MNQKSNPKPWQRHRAHGISKVLKTFSTSSFSSLSYFSRPKDSSHRKISKARNEKNGLFSNTEENRYQAKKIIENYSNPLYKMYRE
ncbi:unnamed protein product [Dovyalis caffra]|uniref:Uncharacterized protein n=1 Tax=Dovyalis caffra TaxID=77055 RepID=A0AAV1SUZ7_9ROSI|nr:unnamed protein product [Dovyalis caffra]